MQVQIYTLTGQKLLDETVTPTQASPIALGERLANGVYLYKLTVQRPDGTMQHTELKKLLIQR